MKQTISTSIKNIKRDWHLIDIRDQILGRVSVKIAQMLMGKGKPYFVRNLDCGDHVVVINSNKFKITGVKEEQKKYYHHSGYPGGLKTINMAKLRQEKPEEIIKKAVKGMLPQNKIGRSQIKRLYIYKEEDHPYKDKFK